MINNKLIIFIAVFFCMIPLHSHADYQVEFNPSVSISETYDDNIDLYSRNEIADWLTTISPRIGLDIDSEKSSLLLNYGPVIVRYKDEYQYNTIRHYGTLTFGRQLTDHLRFDLTDTYLQSEQPVEETEDIYIARQTRNVYTRNRGSADVTYVFFRPENSLNLGYDYSWLKNRDVTLLDNNAYSPNAELIYWLNDNNGLEVSYEGLLVNYSRGGEDLSEESSSRDRVGIRYLRRFSEHTTAFGGYTYSNNYTGDTENYIIHEGLIGFSHDFSANTSLSLSGGYFLLKNESSDDDNGYSYDISLEKSFRRGNITVEGSGGWREGYLEIESRGYTKYWSMVSTFNYQVMENLSNYGSLSSMHDKDETGQSSKNHRTNYGWRFSFMRWFSLSLDYYYLTRDDDVDIYDYRVNRIMITLRASRVFR